MNTMENYVEEGMDYLMGLFDLYYSMDPDGGLVEADFYCKENDWSQDELYYLVKKMVKNMKKILISKEGAYCNFKGDVRKLTSKMVEKVPLPNHGYRVFVTWNHN